ncbi:MAG: DUF1667 domain-containing protein [Clostridium sp.]|nr:DUF1667 domain-containing protein [Clostridium sp.]
MEKELICISCPNGCHLKVDAENDVVKGNKCPRGKEYGLNEVKHPVRVITSTMKVEGGTFPVVSVKTKTAIPKELNFKCMEEINKVTVKAPVHIGDILISNVLDTGVDIIATKNIETI